MSTLFLHPKYSALYSEINRTWDDYARTLNAHCWYNLQDIPLEYRLKALEELEKKMKGYFENENLG